ncbi:MAG: hypothetical protein WBV78_11835 [Roseobacter sp.]
MTNTRKMFFAAAALFALCGMVWGIQMSATNDHSLSPAHGHLNLIGFVMMSVFGAYYALTPLAGRSRTAKVMCGWLLHSKTFLIRFVHLSEAVMCPACLRGFDRWP